MPGKDNTGPSPSQEDDHLTTAAESKPTDHNQADPSMLRMNRSWFGKPVEEVDPLIFEDTFCVITRKTDRHYIYRFSCSKSLFLMGPLNPIRKLAIYVTTHRWFDILIILTILCNCITLGMITNIFKEGEPHTKIKPDYDYVINKVEYAFLAIYTVEVILKVIAKGFILNKFSYLRNRWNILDLIVVASGFTTLIQEMVYVDPGRASDDIAADDNELNFLRTFRVLRAVKTISILPGLKFMINALISSVVHLLEVMALIFVCLMIFAIFALEIFQGNLRQKCVIDKGGPMDPDNVVNQPISTISDPNLRDKLWTEWVSDWRNWKRRDFPEDEPTQCGNDTDRRQCGEGYTCIGQLGDNPDDGWTSFDNIFASMLSSFQLITADYWERVYDVVVSSSGVWSVLFFIIIIFMGSYYLLNLMLAVVTMSFENEALLLDQGSMTATDRLTLNRRQSNFSFDDLSKLNICKMTHYRKRTKSEKEMLAKRVKDDLSDNEERDKEHDAHLDDAILNLLGMKMALQKEAENDLTAKPSITMSVGFKSNDRSSIQKTPTKHSRHSSSRKAPSNSEQGSAFEKEESETSESDVEMDVSPSRATFPGFSAKISMLLKAHLRPVVTHLCFETTITISIILNTLCLAMEHHGASEELQEFLRLSNHGFMAIFTAECIIKLLALQLEYFQSGWNIFDMVIVLTAYIDLAVADTSTGGSGLTVIRSMRLLRVFKLAHSWITMKVLLNIIFASLGDLGNLTCLLLIVIYIFAVMGMQVVGEQYNPGAFDADRNPLKFPRWNWKHFWYAFMMVFRVLCGEWIEPLWECLKAQTYYIEKHNGYHYLSYFKCFAIYLPILIVGNFIVFNLFLALLLNSFDTEELNAQREKELEASGRAENLKNIVGLMMARKEEHEEEEEEHEEEKEIPDAQSSATLAPPPVPVRGASVGKVLPYNLPVASRLTIVDTVARKRWKQAINRIILENRIEIARVAIARAEYKIKRKNAALSNRLFLKNPGMQQGLDNFQHDPTPESSEASVDLSAARDCFPAKVWASKYCPCRKVASRRKGFFRIYIWDTIRGWAVTIVANPTFEYTILALIFASSITLAFEDVHLSSNPGLQKILCILNFVFTGVFIVEMILKWFAIGLYNYFTTFWTILDGFIVSVSLISLYFDITLNTCSGTSRLRTGAVANIAALKALRTLRALRPLRAISRWQGMRIVVNALIHAIPAIFNVLLVCLLFWLVFSIMGVQFFKGEFYRCVDNEGENIDPRVVPNKDVCCAKTDTHDYSWVNQISNYDNVLEGYLSLFQIATFEGWMELMSFSVDSVGVDKQPSLDYQIAYYFFYVVFIIFGSFFALQLFIGVIIDNFNMLKKKYEGSMLEILLTPTQRNYYIAMKNLGKKKPRPVVRKPKSKFRCYFYYVSLSRRLEVFIFVMIFLNVGIEAFVTARTDKLFLHLLSGLKAFFTTIYVLEAIVKICGLGAFYFTVPWNVFDLILVLASLMDVFLTSDTSVVIPIPPSMLRIVRIIRIGRILRMVKAAKGIRKLLFALTISLPALFNIGALLTLITFIYAILGMALFGKAPERWSIDDVFNFKTFLSSNLLLLRLMTVAGWNEVLDSLTVVEPVCGNFRHLECGLPGEPECPQRGFVIAYIVSYLLITNQILINLFIAIILENYVEASDEEDVGIVEDDLEMFYIRWSRYDPYATQFINFEDLSDFLDSLNAPLRVPQPNIVAIVSFNLPIARGNKMHCLDILHALIRYVLGQVDDSPEFRKLQNRMERKFQKQFPNRHLLEIVSTTRRWKLEQNAARIIQREWRRYLVRRYQAAQPVSKPKSKPKVPRKTRGHGGLGHMMNRMGNTSVKNTAVKQIKSTKIEEQKQRNEP